MHLEQHNEQAPSFRLDVPLHTLLTKSSGSSPGLQPVGKPQRFPAPVFPQHPELLGPIDYDWGVAGDHKFNTKQLDHQKGTCQTHCFSTLNHIVGWCYNDQSVIKYFFKQLAHGFQGMKGQM